MIDSRRKPITTSSSNQVPPSSGPRWRISASESPMALLTAAEFPSADRNPISPHTRPSIAGRIRAPPDVARPPRSDISALVRRRAARGGDGACAVATTRPGSEDRSPVVSETTFESTIRASERRFVVGLRRWARGGSAALLLGSLVLLLSGCSIHDTEKHLRFGWHTGVT